MSHMFEKPRGSNWAPPGRAPFAPSLGGASRKGMLQDLPDCMRRAAAGRALVTRSAEPEKAEASGAAAGTKANMAAGGVWSGAVRCGAWGGERLAGTSVITNRLRQGASNDSVVLDSFFTIV